MLILLMLGSLALLMVSSAPLWMWAAPTASETDAPAENLAKDESLGIAPE
jgi:hypothetical protein